MLGRQRQVRAQLQKLLDASLFAIGFWLAHAFRADNEMLAAVHLTPEIAPFSKYSLLLVVIFPVAPFLLELQGFYSRPLIASRRRTAWQLFKACTLAVI